MTHPAHRRPTRTGRRRHRASTPVASAAVVLGPVALAAITLAGIPLAVVALGTVSACTRAAGPAPGSTVETRPSGRAVEALEEAPPAPESGVVEPVAAELAELARLTPPSRPLVDRLRRIDSGLSEEEAARRLAEAARLPPSAAVQRLAPQEGIGGEGDLELGVRFDSMDVTECCDAGTSNPPDPELAAGPGHLLAVVNAALEIYAPSGASLFGPLPLETFFAALGPPCSSFPFDPNALYDEAADRYLIAADGNRTVYCLGVSQTGDPTGAYFFYAIPTNVGGEQFDYPRAGVGRDAIYLGANMFGSGTGRIWALDKTALYAGQPATFISHDLGSNMTPQPLRLHGFANGTWPVSGPHYFFTSRLASAGQFGLFAWDDPFGADDLTDVATLDLPAEHGVTVAFPVMSPQAGGNPITANDARPLDFEYADGMGWAVNHVACNPGGGTVNCIQWAEIDLAAGEVAQAGVFASNGQFRYFPDVAANRCGDVVIGYTKSTAATFPGVWATGRQADDPPGTVQAEVAIRGGLAAIGEAGRWGDYTGMTIGADGLTFWYLGEYGKAVAPPRNWGTYAVSLTFAGCLPAAMFADGFESGNTSAWN